jgi:hypothetical protein
VQQQSKLTQAETAPLNKLRTAPLNTIRTTTAGVVEKSALTCRLPSRHFLVQLLPRFLRLVDQLGDRGPVLQKEKERQRREIGGRPASSTLLTEKSGPQSVKICGSARKQHAAGCGWRRFAHQVETGGHNQVGQRRVTRLLHTHVKERHGAICERRENESGPRKRAKPAHG